AVLLDSRNILFAGGTDGAADLDSATEYDAGAVSPAASDVAPPRHMAHTRASFTGTLLATGGKVLIVGGNTGNDTAELFDPAGKTFSDTAEVSTTSLEDKRFHTAVLIDPSSVVNGGKVLISGGVTSGQSPSSTQFLYTPPNGPTPGSFAPTGALRVGRSHHAAIALSNYQVLICGGTDGTTLNKCERYHPDTETSFPTAPMLLGRQDFGLAPITISSLAEQIASGGTDASVMNVAEAYDLNAD
ncbi:MAG: hypothetical protein ACXWLR_03670, partial [Myxococcales bacterium]